MVKLLNIWSSSVIIETRVIGYWLGKLVTVKLSTFIKQLEAYGLRIEGTPSGNFYIMSAGTVIEPFTVISVEGEPVLLQSQVLALMEVVRTYKGEEIATNISLQQIKELVRRL